MPALLRTALVVVNIIAFFAYGVDKHRARLKKWRISEFTLLMLAVLGGTPGSLLGQQVFHHKTQKSKFRRVFFTIVWVQVVAGSLLLLIQ
jgi:uncharacterized membrane protein YsdA (DUF1294 family)